MRNLVVSIVLVLAVGAGLPEVCGGRAARLLTSAAPGGAIDSGAMQPAGTAAIGGRRASLSGHAHQRPTSPPMPAGAATAARVPSSAARHAVVRAPLTGSPAAEPLSDRAPPSRLFA